MTDTATIQDGAVYEATHYDVVDRLSAKYNTPELGDRAKSLMTAIDMSAPTLQAHIADALDTLNEDQARTEIMGSLSSVFGVAGQNVYSFVTEAYLAVKQAQDVGNHYKGRLDDALTERDAALERTRHAQELFDTRKDIIDLYQRQQETEQKRYDDVKNERDDFLRQREEARSLGAKVLADNKTLEAEVQQYQQSAQNFETAANRANAQLGVARNDIVDRERTIGRWKLATGIAGGALAAVLGIGYLMSGDSEEASKSVQPLYAQGTTLNTPKYTDAFKKDTVVRTISKDALIEQEDFNVNIARDAYEVLDNVLARAEYNDDVEHRLGRRQFNSRELRDAINAINKLTTNTPGIITLEKVIEADKLVGKRGGLKNLMEAQK